MSQAMTDSDQLQELDWDSTVPCDARSQSCKHDAVAIILFHQHGHAEYEPNPWWTACQTHLDAAQERKTACSGCKQPLVVQQVKSL